MIIRHIDRSERGLALYYLLCTLVSTASFLLMGVWQPPGRLGAVFFTCAGCCIVLAVWLGTRCTRHGAARTITGARHNGRSGVGHARHTVVTLPIQQPRKPPGRRA